MVKEKLLKGIVFVVGGGKKDELMIVKVNDIVIFGQYFGMEIKVDGKILLIMCELDIYGIVG